MAPESSQLHSLQGCGKEYSRISASRAINLLFPVFRQGDCTVNVIQTANEPLDNTETHTQKRDAIYNILGATAYPLQLKFQAVLPQIYLLVCVIFCNTLGKAHQSKMILSSTHFIVCSEWLLFRVIATVLIASVDIFFKLERKKEY